MKTNLSLLAGVAAGALIACAPTGAEAKTVRKPAASTSTSNAEIEALKAQVAALTARLDAQDAASKAASDQAAAAQATATAAQEQASAAKVAVDAQAKAMPAAVDKQMASWKPKGTWYADTQVSGRMYFNFSSINQKSNGADSTANGYGFNVKRFYLGVDHSFSPVFSANLTMDASNVIGQTSNGNFATPTGTVPATGTTVALNNEALIGRGFYIKKAYLQAKISPALVIKLGAADMPWIPYVEGVYGYRHVDLTLIDRISLGTSSDWGVHVSGDLAGGLISYQVSLVDGGGYRNVKVTNSMDVEGRVSMNYKGFFAAVGGYTGKLGNDTQGATTFNTASRFNALAGFKNKMFTAGVEYYRSHDYTNNGVNYITTNVDDKGEGISAFGSVQFTPKWSVFGRYDHVKPRKDALPALKDDYFNAGIQYSPAKIVDLAFVYKRDKAQNGTIATSNGTIGGSIDGTYDELGLFGQFRF